MPRRRSPKTELDLAVRAAEVSVQLPKSVRCSCQPWPCAGWSGCDPRCRACRGGPLITDAEARWVETGKDRQGREVELVGIRWRPKHKPRVPDAKQPGSQGDRRSR